MHIIEMPHKNKWLSIFHINACSLNNSFGDLQHLLTCTKKVGTIAISETRITKHLSLLNNLNVNNCFFEFTPTETSAGGTLLYIANHLSYKCCNDVISIKRMNWNLLSLKLWTQVIYRHLSVDLTDFNYSYLNKLLESISKEQKTIFLLGDFNVNLLNYNEHNQTNKFLDSPASNSCIPK